jgi:hypothetical protein
MDKFSDLYDFIDLARANRKYPENTANNLKSSLKIFEKELNPDELKSVSMIRDSIEEIFRSVVVANKHKSILSLNTYKARLLKVINDYKKYGADPAKIKNWQAKTRKSTPLLIDKDKKDKEKINLSNSIYSPVENAHKIELCLESGCTTIIIPKKITRHEVDIIKKIIESLT